MSPVLQIFTALILLACLGEIGIFTAVVYLNRRAAAANLARPKRLPRQLAKRSQDFDEHGRSF